MDSAQAIELGDFSKSRRGLAGRGPLSLGTSLGPAGKTVWNPWRGQAVGRGRRKPRWRGAGH